MVQNDSLLNSCDMNNNLTLKYIGICDYTVQKNDTKLCSILIIKTVY